MNYQDYEPDNEEKKSGKVFYWVLAACMIAVCGVIVTTVAGTLPKDIPEETQRVTTITTTVKSTSSIQQVVIPATDIPDDRTTTTTHTTTTTTTAKPADLFVLPVSNRVLRPFNETLQYSETLGEWRTHNGTDFEAEENQSVKAVAEGTIQTVVKDALWGNIIEIDHGGKRVSRYCGVTATGIKQGDTVKA
ncbi:MAG: M23 family metallopeptidase, partial [Clostridia bacterium]|nr:M23 family metallopeptidase [Clostridia bacterium]